MAGRRISPGAIRCRCRDGFDYRKSRGSFREWVTLGFKRTDGGNLPTTTTRDEATLLFPSGARGPAFLVTKNFEVIKTYNISDVYALAVLHLADRFRGAPPFAGRWPDNDVQLSREDRMTIQKELAKAGFKPSNLQGMIDFDQRDDIRADAGEIRDDAGRASDAGVFGAVGGEVGELIA